MKSSKLDQIRKKLYIVIFEADTFWGKFFDVALLFAICISVLVVMLESVESVEMQYGNELYIIEWVFTILFSFEYLARLYVIDKPRKYAFSFFGMVDLLSILPTFIGLFVSGAHMLLVIRSIRLLRVFRVFKLVRFLGEASQLSAALRSSREKITVFLVSVAVLVVILGSLMFLIEGKENGFSSIPRSIYWAIVTLTTVGYGDIAPQTVLGQALASFIMILGYGIIAVPTGIVTSEITKVHHLKQNTSKICSECNYTESDHKAEYCKMCGSKFS